MFISGATGIHAASINGFFDPTQEEGPDGRVLYRKRGNANVCIERSTNDTWQIKPVSSKGGNSCWAHSGHYHHLSYLLDDGYRTLQACTSLAWMVADGEKFSKAPGVKIVTEAEVSCCCMRS